MAFRIIDEIAGALPNLNAIQMQILLYHQNNPACCIAELADVIGIPDKTAQFAIKVMTEKGKPGRPRKALGLLTCTRCKHDRRRYELKLTPRGREIARLLQTLNGRITP